jgi:glycosyltransferase involved in cell wall biosynthesis
MITKMLESQPLVSILMPSYNHAPFVESAVRSAMEQKGVNFELLVIDDGSTDRSPAILQKLSGELGFYFLARENRGMVATLNELAAIAKGKYICTLASDDIMPQGRLEIQVRYMEEHPDIPVCFGQARRIFPDGELEKSADPYYLKSIPQVNFTELFLGKKALHGCTELIRRTAFDSVGGYNQEFKIEDYPLWLAIANRFGNIYVLSDIFCHYRILAEEKNMHRNLTLIFTQILKILHCYEKHIFYKKAVNNWKSNWLSCLIYCDKKEAIKMLPKLFSFSFIFFRQLPKLFISKNFLRKRRFKQAN